MIPNRQQVEVIGYGSFLGVPLFGASYQAWTVMILPPGGFLAIGIILLVFGAIRRRNAASGGEG